MADCDPPEANRWGSPQPEAKGDWLWPARPIPECFEVAEGLRLELTARHFDEPRLEEDLRAESVKVERDSLEVKEEVEDLVFLYQEIPVDEEPEVLDFAETLGAEEKKVEVEEVAFAEDPTAEERATLRDEPSLEEALERSLWSVLRDEPQVEESQEAEVTYSAVEWNQLSNWEWARWDNLDYTWDELEGDITEVDTL